MEVQIPGRTALVTGGGTGIGKAIAVALARGGVDVAITYFSHADSAEETVDAIQALGRKAHALALDATDSARVDQIVPQAAQRLGGSIDFLVNNAGHMVGRVPIADMDGEHWRKVMAVNLDSAFYVTHAALPFLSPGRGRIVYVSSLAAHTGGANGATAYAAAKAGLIGLTRGLAKELGPRGITVNAVAPGLILETAFHQTFTSPEAIRATIAGIPLGHAGAPDDVAGAVLYLCSTMAAFVTGEVMEINGGAWFA